MYAPSVKPLKRLVTAMNRRIEHPNLPTSDVIICALGQGNNETSAELKRLGVSVLTPKTDVRLVAPENNHADMLMLHLYDEIVFSQAQDELSYHLNALGFVSRILSRPPEPAYPKNILLNAAVVGNRFFAHKSSIKLFEPNPRFTFIPVRQGYAKCSSCIINENAVITEDENLYAVMTASGLDVLKIKKGEIALKGMPYGFFGGATGLLSRNTLAINGELQYNSDRDKILSFLKNYQIEAVSLKKGAPEDIGGILPLAETGEKK